MEHYFTNLMVMLSLIGLGTAGSSSALADDRRERKPNIIVIFTDDHGYADLGVQGQRDDLKTPHLDKLADDGVRCTSGYVTAPQCIPSRAGLLSGRYQTRFGLDANGTIPMPLDEVLIPERLQEAGYTTGMVGKWHLEPNHQQRLWIKKNLGIVEQVKPSSIPARMKTPYMPDHRGFDDVFCGYINHYRVSYDLRSKDVRPVKTIKAPGYRLDIQTKASLAFIDRHHDKPFFLYLAYYAPHVPLDATEQYLERFPGDMPRRRRIALAMIAAMDDGVGRIRDRLEQYNIADNTLIFFISDNGAPLKIHMEDKPGNGPGWDGSRNDPWVGEKGMLTEGGIRVPFLVTWPGKIPAAKVYDQPVTTLDVGATAVALAGLVAPDTLDGVNLIPYLTGEAKASPHESIFWRFWNQSAIRKGKWKYLQAGGERKYLFDLSSPEHETKNLIATYPEVAAKMQAELSAWAAEQKNAGIPDGELRRGEESNWYDHYLPKP
ncbi:MAG: sulfatase family protein [Phycisphaeraceae bacterium]